MMSKKKLISWALYDWANSAFATTVMSGFFPIMFSNFWSKGTSAAETTARLGHILSVTGFVMAIMAPLLGALADTRGLKKMFVFLFMILGAASTALLFFVGEGDWMTAALVYGCAFIGFSSSCVFYDSLLPSVATGKDTSRASSLGFGLGYLGGGTLFAFNTFMVLNPTIFGLADKGEAVRYSFISVAIWWVLFSLPLFFVIPEPPTGHNEQPITRAIVEAFKSVWTTFLKILNNKSLALFILAYCLYIDGVNTVISMAVTYGKSLNFEDSALITALLVVQFVGFPFAILFGRLSGRFGNKGPILFAIGVYVFVVISATRMTTIQEFYALAITIGMVQGGIQALSRAMFSNMIPADHSAEYFGFYNLIGKFASVIGPFLVGTVSLMTGDTRMGMLGLLILFGIGGFTLAQVKEAKT